MQNFKTCSKQGQFRSVCEMRTAVLRDLNRSKRRKRRNTRAEFDACGLIFLRLLRLLLFKTSGSLLKLRT